MTLHDDQKTLSIWFKPLTKHSFISYVDFQIHVQVVLWNFTTPTPLPNNLIYIFEQWISIYVINTTHAQTMFFG
jgi:hypothetical protein